MYKPRCCLTMSGEGIGGGRCDDTKCGWEIVYQDSQEETDGREGGELKREHRKGVEQ